MILITPSQIYLRFFSLHIIFLEIIFYYCYDLVKLVT